MNYRTLSALLLTLSAALGYMLLESMNQAQTLLADNKLLAAELLKPHPVHDADITAWIGKDKKLTVVVNGAFMHRYDVTCYEGNVSKL